MAVKKSELYSSLWSSCDELRGGMDASQYKDYVLVLLFVKYVSDKYAGQPYAPITIPAGASFADMVQFKGKADIGDQINKKILGPLALANNLSDMPDFNDPNKLGSGKEMVDRLTSLISIFENRALDFSKNRADGDDLLGDAYEFLMRHFATESGKSKGQFYTPAEVSRVIAQILGIRHADTSNDTTVYDPTCGSGSLLLKIGDAARHGGKDVKVSIYGQEKDSSTAGLARMNMILHDYATAEIQQGNTLANPKFLDGEQIMTFDYVVANPPFSDKRWSSGLHPDEGGEPPADGKIVSKSYGRFDGYGIPPAKQGDYAYLLHILRSMKSTGKGACILPHGVLFRGNAEGQIRRNLVQRGVIKGIIGLPANLFFGTGIPACIIVLDKEHAQARKGIFLIDASKGFRKDGNKNRLREQDIHRIVDTFTRQVEIPGYSRLVPVAEIADPKNDYNLNLPRYIDSSEPEDLHDIDGHLRGGIPERDIVALSRYWQVIPGVRDALFQQGNRPGYKLLRVAAADVKTTIFSHPEFSAFQQTVTTLFAKWRQATRPRLRGLSPGIHPKTLVETIAEDLLLTFASAPLIDPYDVYQHLLDYWADTLQDECYLVTDADWASAAQPVLIIENKANKVKQKPDFSIGKMKYQTELLSAQLIIGRYFAEDQAALSEKEAERTALEQQIEELVEEHSNEGGLLDEARNEKDKITKASVQARLKELSQSQKTSKESQTELWKASTPDDESDEAERKVLTEYLELCEKESELGKQVKALEESLMTRVLARFATLSPDEIKALVVDDKWLHALEESVMGELDRVSQTLTSRIRQLAERYASPLPELTDEVARLSQRVTQHLTKMGATWN